MSTSVFISRAHLVYNLASPMHVASVCITVLLIKKTLFSWCPPSALAFTSFLSPLLQDSLNCEGRVLTGTAHLVLYDEVFHFAYCLASVSTRWVGSFSDDGEARNWYRVQKVFRRHFTVTFIYLFVFFNFIYILTYLCFRIVLIGFILDPVLSSLRF